ncbi:MAG: response regulator transcription factor [Bacteroidales bacterium]|nr:response regulator transcription factor [Bacteroidales bacterium]
MSAQVLLVEDELSLASIVRDALETQDFDVTIAADGAEGLRRYFEMHPDILVVDVMMPKMSGFDMVKAIRQSDTQTPILFLTAKTSVDDVVTGFNLGANDYLKKPFAIPELVVRMKALLGRKTGPAKDNATFTLEDFQFNPETAHLWYRPTGESTILPRREADILQRLCQHQGEIVPTQNILLDLWGDDDFFNTRSLQVLITRLRRALSKDPHLRIINVRGTGYKLIAE